MTKIEEKIAKLTALSKILEQVEWFIENKDAMYELTMPQLDIAVEELKDIKALLEKRI